MSGRYWITGVQLGMIKALNKVKGKDIDKICDEVLDEQFITDCPTDEDKAFFMKSIHSLKVMNDG